MCSNVYEAFFLFGNKGEQKHKVLDTHQLYKQWLCKFYKVHHEGYIELHTMEKVQKYKYLVSQKKSVENEDLYKAVFNKKNDNTQIMRKIQFRSSFKINVTWKGFNALTPDWFGIFS